MTEGEYEDGEYEDNGYDPDDTQTEETDPDEIDPAFYEFYHEIHKIMFDFAFPQYNDIPSGLCKQFMILLIVFNVCRKFFLPEFLMRGGSGGIFASRMTVPETAVDENNSFVL